MKYIVILLTFSIIMGSTSCDLFNWKDDPITELEKLPPVTQTGENTFGYLVNGEAVVVNNTAKITAIYQRGLFQLGGGIENENYDIDIKIVLTDPLLEGIYYDLTQINKFRAKYIDINIIEHCKYQYEDTYTGKVKLLKIDRKNFILSGIFNFSTVVDTCDTIEITEGRFDVQYIP